MTHVRTSAPGSQDSSDTCSSCHHSSIGLWTAVDCGHYICKECLVENERSSEGPPCPVCECKTLFLCPGSKYGCKYQSSTVANCSGHQRTCPRRPVRCPNECPSIVANIGLPKHLVDECSRRAQECRFCLQNFFVSEIRNHHDECEEYPVKCQYCKEENIRRGSFKEHGTNCRKTPKACKMAALGCSFIANDDDIERHMTLQEHVFGIHELKMQANKLESEVRQLRDERNWEKQGREKAEEMRKKESQKQDQEIQKLRAELQELQVQFRGLCENR